MLHSPVPAWSRTAGTRTPRGMPDVNAGAIGLVVAHHLQFAHPVAPPPKAPAFKAPPEDLGIYEGQWKEFERSWGAFLSTAKIPDQ